MWELSEIGKGDEDMQSLSYKDSLHESWGCNVQHREYSHIVSDVIVTL